jgi:hypothetical protein
MNDGISNFKKWYYCSTRKSIFDPIKDRLELIVVHTAPRKMRPHGYEKSPTHEVYSSKIQNVVRVREVPSSNLGTPTDQKETSQHGTSLFDVHDWIVQVRSRMELVLIFKHGSRHRV